MDLAVASGLAMATAGWEDRAATVEVLALFRALCQASPEDWEQAEVGSDRGLPELVGPDRHLAVMVDTQAEGKQSAAAMVGS